ncbi:MAG TPA: ABC transporter substrate-binding protein, partial [Solirubrobacterales bacterium]|nr:ABC transporter substrate-binding protein [Solirubrobacterales bacterium]
MGSRLAAAVAVATLLLAVAGCGGSSDREEERPTRIVSLSPSATETLFAIGAGDQVIAVDEESDHPRGVPRTDLSSYQPNVEAIVGYEPDLVVLPASVPRDVPAGLRKVGLPVIAQPAPANLDDAYAQMRELGKATG